MSAENVHHAIHLTFCKNIPNINISSTIFLWRLKSYFQDVPKGMYFPGENIKRKKIRKRKRKLFHAYKEDLNVLKIMGAWILCAKGFHKIVTNCFIHSYSTRFCHTVWETLINICQPVILSQNTSFAQINRLVWGYNDHLCLRNTQFVDTCCSLEAPIHSKLFIPGQKQQ